LLFVSGDAGGRIAKAIAAAVAYFDKHNHIVLFHDEVDFAAALMDVCGDEAQSFALEKAARLKLIRYLMPAAGAMDCRQRALECR